MLILLLKQNELKERELQYKETIQQKEKKNEEFLNKIKEYEHSVQVYREQQQVERLKLNKNELNVIFKLYSFDLFN